MKILLAVVLAGMTVCPARLGLAQDNLSVPPEPFGFKMGMTQNQVIALVGKDAIKEEKEGVLTLSTAPKPYPDFTEYLLVFSPKQGLLKVGAVTKEMNSDDEGDQLRDEFNKIVAAVANKYGKPQMTDFIRNQDEADQKFWMMSLLDKERTLEADWNYKKSRGGNTETGISVEVNPISISSGLIFIGYEFPGWNAYVDSKQTKQDNAF